MGGKKGSPCITPTPTPLVLTLACNAAVVKDGVKKKAETQNTGGAP